MLDKTKKMDEIKYLLVNIRIDDYRKQLLIYLNRKDSSKL